MRLGYNTNGLSDISLVDAIDALARIGYRGVAITLDRCFLDPFSPGLGTQLCEAKEALSAHGMSVVIETGARHLLNPLVKHEPTLVSSLPSDRARRIDFLQRAINIAEELQAPCVSIWSGRVRDGASDEESLDRLASGMVDILRYASSRNVYIAFEPEPDMLIDTMSRFQRLVDALRERGAALSHLKLTIDIGHLHCQGEVPIADRLRYWASHIVNIHIEDMRAGIHEHLMFGDGEIDFPPIIEALSCINYRGLVNVELSRHSHVGLEAAQQSYDFLRTLVEQLAGGTIERQQ